MTVEQILGQLANVRKSGSGWTALCPAHDDRSPSLSIRAGDGGRVLLHCHAGCTTEAVCAALEIEMRDLSGDGGPAPRIVREYDYVDENGALLYQVCRFEPKDFRQRRPDGNGGWTWNLNGTRRVLYRLPEVLEAKSVLVCEGERDCETAKVLGFVATTSGAAGSWKSEYSEILRGKIVTVIADADEPGRRHAEQIAQSLARKVESLKVIELPGFKDISDWVAGGGTKNALKDFMETSPKWTPQNIPPAERANRVNPWSLAIDMDTFLDGEEEAVDFLFPPVIASEAVTEIFSPRGLGKSLWALFAAVSLARAGRKVLLIDRDNPRRLVKDRLRSFGATRELSNLKILSRENAPPLTNGRAWAEFPYFDYDLVIVDSIDSAAEGIGEQDSTKPSLAIAPLLDIARRENGPAVLLLGNTIKSAAHSRGSGVIEDRADIVFEVRDATRASL